MFVTDLEEEEEVEETAPLLPPSSLFDAPTYPPFHIFVSPGKDSMALWLFLFSQPSFRPPYYSCTGAL